jgi:hypothetical protein
MTLWVNFCRAISRNARLLYPTKPPRRSFAIEAVTGQFRTHAPQQTTAKLLYSITWSARTSTVPGMVRPSAFAVLRLMTSSNLVGCSIGSSAGLAPFRILST